MIVPTKYYTLFLWTWEIQLWTIDRLGNKDKIVNLLKIIGIQFYVQNYDLVTYSNQNSDWMRSKKAITINTIPIILHEKVRKNWKVFFWCFFFLKIKLGSAIQMKKPRMIFMKAPIIQFIDFDFSLRNLLSPEFQHTLRLNFVFFLLHCHRRQLKLAWLFLLKNLVKRQS